MLAGAPRPRPPPPRGPSARLCAFCKRRAGALHEQHEEVLEACTTDIRKGLDEADLKSALQSQGLYPQHDELKHAQQVMSVGTPTPLHDVAKVARYLASTGCKRGLHALPHAWRGIRLDQLQDLHRVCLRSGWLRERCDDHYIMNASAIEVGAEHAMAENLYALDKFFVRPVTDADAAARCHLPDAVVRQVPPPPKYPCSYSQLMNPDGLGVDLFVSHYWGHPFDKTVASLALYSKENFAGLRRSSPGETVFWICLFALNQHRVLDELGSGPLEAPFNIALMKSQAGVVMVLDAEAAPLSRIWCLFEVSRASDLDRPIRLLTEEGLAGAAPRARGISRKLVQRLRTISAGDANASSEEDKFAIWSRIADSFVRGHVFERLVVQAYREGAMSKEFFGNFDEKVRELLATPLFKAALSEGCSDAALEYVAMGARYTVADLLSLEKMGVDLTGTIPCHRYGMDGVVTLPWLTACSDSAMELLFLLDRRADLNHVSSFCRRGAMTEPQMSFDAMSPLMVACRYGHLSAASTLLDRRAELDLRSQGQKTALAYASFGVWSDNNRTELMRLLLQHRADANSEDGLTSCALHWVMGSDVIEPAELLINARASVNTRDDEGSTPMHVAAKRGVVDRAALLLAHGADLEAQKHDGCRPLHRAASNGHRAMVAWLLEQGAAAQSPNSAGGTARDLAMAAGHAEVLDLLPD